MLYQPIKYLCGKVYYQRNKMTEEINKTWSKRYMGAPWILEAWLLFLLKGGL